MNKLSKKDFRNQIMNIENGIINSGHKDVIKGDSMFYDFKTRN